MTHGTKGTDRTSGTNRTNRTDRINGPGRFRVSLFPISQFVRPRLTRTLAASAPAKPNSKRDTASGSTEIREADHGIPWPGAGRSGRSGGTSFPDAPITGVDHGFAEFATIWHAGC